MKPPNQTTIEQAYAGFNSRDIDEVLSLMHPEVHWPKAFEGAFATGHEEIRDYWTRQWTEINPRVTPTAFTSREDGSLAVDVHQVVHDMQGALLLDDMVKHVYSFREGLISGMRIELN
jgi:ketosteroid isomerase-like protein